MKRKLAAITIDIEPDYANTKGDIRLFDEPALFERFVDIVKRNNIKVTGFLVTSILGRYGESVRKLAREIPIEFGLHSHHHNTETSGNRDEIELCARTFRQFFGHDALGYRAPIGAMTRDGLNNLMDLGFRYDASVFPSVRPGKNGYINLHMPNVPFRVTRGNDFIIEFPFTALNGLRLQYGLGWVKLLGLPLYWWVERVFRLPYAAVFTMHPHDLYPPHITDGVTALEKAALLRNSARGFEYFEATLAHLKKNNYEFVHMSELCDYVQTLSNVRKMPIEQWRYYLLKDFPWTNTSIATSKSTPN